MEKPKNIGKRLSEKECDPPGKYDDIIHLPHYRNPLRIPLPNSHRAAQFAPFAALNGHEDVIKEAEDNSSKTTTALL